MSARAFRLLARTSLVIVLLLIGMAMTASSQPTVYIPTAADGATASSVLEGACIGCSVTDLDDVIGRRVDPATIAVPVGILASAGIRVDLPATERPNTRAGFVIRSGAGIVDVSLLDRITVRTYLGNEEQETAAGSSVLSLNLLAGNRSKVTVRARKPYDAVEFEVAGAVVLGTQIDVQYAIITRPTTVDRIVALASEGATASGETSGLCLGCTVTDIGQAIDLPVATAADLFAPIGVLGSLSMTVRYGTLLPARTWTGFWMTANADLLDLTVLGAVTLEALDGPTVVASASGDDLRVTVRPDGLAFVRFRTSQAFDAVRIRLESLVGVSQELHVHQAMTVPIDPVDLQAAPSVAGPAGVEARAAAGVAVRLGAPSPNPSSGLARVALRSESATSVRVAVYDALGREVAVLHDGTIEAAGRDLTLEGGSLAPGTYVVRAQSGSSAPVSRVLTIGR